MLCTKESEVRENFLAEQKFSKFSIVSQIMVRNYSTLRCFCATRSVFAAAKDNHSVTFVAIQPVFKYKCCVFKINQLLIGS